MFSTDSGTHSWTYCTTFFYSHLDKLSYTILIENLEWIHTQNFFLQIYRQETCDVVARITECHLGEVIGSKREIFSFRCNFICSQGCSWNFNHCTDFKLHFNAFLIEYLFGSLEDNIFLLFELVQYTDKRNHNFWSRIFAFLL